MKKLTRLYAIPYFIWVACFVVIPLFVLLMQSLIRDGKLSIANYVEFFTTPIYLQLLVQSIGYALIITILCLVVSYPMAYFLTKCKHRDLWLMLIILPTWINLLLKAYAFMGILAKNGSLNKILVLLGLQPTSLLFTGLGFVIVATYIEIPFMVMPIYTALVEISPALPKASQDLGANSWQTFWQITIPLSLSGVKAGIQAVFIPSLSLFMLTRLISGNRVMTLGTAIEQHFLVTQNWGMGATIGIVLVVLMVALMWLTRKESE